MVGDELCLIDEDLIAMRPCLWQVRSVAGCHGVTDEIWRAGIEADDWPPDERSYAQNEQELDCPHGHCETYSDKYNTMEQRFPRR